MTSSARAIARIAGKKSKQTAASLVLLGDAEMGLRQILAGQLLPESDLTKALASK